MGITWPCVEHEALINIALADTRAHIVCPYNRTSLPPRVLADAARTHPILAWGCHRRDSPSYGDPRAVAAAFDPPLSALPDDAEVVVINTITGPRTARQLVHGSVRGSGCRRSGSPTSGSRSTSWPPTPSCTLAAADCFDLEGRKLPGGPGRRRGPDHRPHCRPPPPSALRHRSRAIRRPPGRRPGARTPHRRWHQRAGLLPAQLTEPHPHGGRSSSPADIEQRVGLASSRQLAILGAGPALMHTLATDQYRRRSTAQAWSLPVARRTRPG